MPSSSISTLYKTKSLSLGQSVNCNECSNPICIHNTTDEERAELLREYLNALPCDPLLMPRTKDGKKPLIEEEELGLDTPEARELLVSGEEAIQRIKEEGATGYCLYAGKPTHNTERLAFADHDDLDTFPLSTLPDTLTVRSGSGDGYHETYLNDGSVRNALGKGDMAGCGEIRADNWLVVTPGSIHPSGGIYHTTQERELATLSNTDIPRELQRGSLSGEEAGEITEEDIDRATEEVDTDTVDIAILHFNEWKEDRNMSAWYCIQDRASGGRGDYGDSLSREDGKIDRDPQEKTVLTHLYGVYSELGYSDSRAKDLAHHLLTHYCIESNGGNTKDGRPRKWLKRGSDYKAKQLRYAAMQFDKDAFRRFKNKSTHRTTRWKRRNNEYGEPTRDICLFVTNLLAGEYDDYSAEEIHEYALPDYSFNLTVPELKALVANKADHMYNDTPRPSSDEDTGSQVLYPKKSTVTEVCKMVDGVYKGNAECSFGECLKRLQQRGEIKLACIREGVDYRVYPAHLDDPCNAEWVRHEGVKINQSN